MDFTKLPLKEDLVAQIRSKKITYRDFADKFCEIRLKPKDTLTSDDYQFLRDSIEVFKLDPKEFSTRK